jgi:hypothetical protein
MFFHRRFFAFFRGIVNDFLFEKWQVFPGMGGRLFPESPAAISRNQWQVSAGISILGFYFF